MLRQNLKRNTKINMIMSQAHIMLQQDYGMMESYNPKKQDKH